MERRCLMDCKVHKRQAFCCAVNDYLLQLKASGRRATTIASYGESLGSLGRRLGASIPLEIVSPVQLNTAVVLRISDTTEECLVIKRYFWSPQKPIIEPTKWSIFLSLRIRRHRFRVCNILALTIG
jgi:hypothetical protein